MLDGVFKRLCREAKRADNQHWHFAIPCSSFSVMNVHMNKGTRSNFVPAGNDSLPREILGNTLLDRCLVLIRLLAIGGNTWTLENPGASYLFKMPKVKKLLKRQSTRSAFLDQCMYNLKIPGCRSGEFVKKFSRIIGNIDLHSLAIKCKGEHSHVQAIGAVQFKGKSHKRSALAGRYPAMLCDAVQRAALLSHP